VQPEGSQVNTRYYHESINTDVDFFMGSKRDGSSHPFRGDISKLSRVVLQGPHDRWGKGTAGSSTKLLSVICWSDSIGYYISCPDAMAVHRS